MSPRWPHLLLLCGVAAAPASAQEPAAVPFGRQLRAAIDRAETGVVMVVASQLKYADPPADERAALGYRGGYLKKLGDDPRLDLADADNLAEYQSGSGLVLDASGLILTSYHLVERATKLYVRTPAGKGCYCDIHAADMRSDLAVLRPLEPLFGVQPVRFADVRVAQGAQDRDATVFRGLPVFALGHAAAAGFVDGSASASWGIISNVRRRAAGPNREDSPARSARPLSAYGSLLQTDARVALGSSGAGLFNMDGELVGIAAPLAGVAGSDVSGGYAAPVDANHRRIIETLRQGREVEYGFLGVSLHEVGDVPLTRGLRVGLVSPRTPAQLAGLTGDETILAVDGQVLRRQDDLFLTVGAALAGSKVRLTVLRGGRTEDVTVTLAKLSHPLPFIASRPPPAPFGLRVDWSSVMLLQLQLIDRRLGDIGLPAGVAVRSVEPNSPAAARFRALGDDPTRWLVTHVDDRPVPTPRDFLEATQGKPSVRLRAVEPGFGGERERFITLP